MNILYGVQATGNGHISRSREIIAALKKAGHTVQVILSGRDPGQLWDMDIFKPYKVFRGMTLVTAKGRLRLIKTARQISLRQLWRDIHAYRATRAFDVALIDFEPVTAHIARRLGIPSIGIGHQYAFNYPVPTAKRDPLARPILKYFAPTDYALGLHWHHFNYPILPPVVPRIPYNSAIQTGKVVVYLPFEKRSDAVRLLRRFTTHDFYYYTDVSEDQDGGNVRLRPFSRSGFIDDLKNCNGVICNAGFELASEALHAGKKLLVKPLAGQLEQTSNAHVLKMLGLGDVMTRLDADAIRAWLVKEAPPPQNYPDVAQLIADWVAEERWSKPEKLVAETWAQVDVEPRDSNPRNRAGRSDIRETKKSYQHVQQL
jgi:uncharacterized protein (TIGR00661 family)